MTFNELKAFAKVTAKIEGCSGTLQWCEKILGNEIVLLIKVYDDDHEGSFLLLESKNCSIILKTKARYEILGEFDLEEK